MPADCLFCQIIAGEIPAGFRYQDDGVIAFDDINPQAPTHVLIIPRVHVQNIVELGADPATATALLAGIRDTALALELPAFRTVFNTGAEVGQSVFHVHAHLLAGRPMGWPPG